MKQIDWIKPLIYDQFQCKGSACRSTCCTGWRITISKAEYQDLKNKLNREKAGTLRRLPEESRSTRMYGEFILDEKGCSLQTEEGLCGLQLSMGVDALPNICIYFPRGGLRCGDEMQVSLSPACEAVLELLLEQECSLTFIREQAPVTSMPLQCFHAETTWHKHLQLQEFCILLLQAEGVSLDQRMAFLGQGIYQIDAFYKNNENHKVSGYMERYLTLLSQTEHMTDLIPDRGFTPTILLEMFVSSTISSNQYKEIVDKIQEELQVTAYIDRGTGKISFTYSTEEYIRRRKAFAEFTSRHPFFLENVMVMLFLKKGWASMPSVDPSIWEQFMYACWVYSNLKFVLTSCIEIVSSDEELLDICVTLFRSWIHNETPREKAIQHFHHTGTDTPAHMAMLVQAG